MKNASYGERREHLLDTLNAFLDERVDEVLDQMDAEGNNETAVSETEHTDEAVHNEEPVEPPAPRWPLEVTGDITENEVDTFLHHDLPLIDNHHYFRTIFG